MSGAVPVPELEDTLQRFGRLSGALQMGLERMEALCRALGDPHRFAPVVHVGGTNGKGSVAATIASILSAAGHLTGLFVSPSLLHLSDCIRLRGEPVDAVQLARALDAVLPHAASLGASQFEALTAAAFVVFRDGGVHVAVVEVGLGGDDDATNVVSPSLAVITSVALDHVSELGPSVEVIARRKAGIIKPGAPVVTGERDPAVLEVFRERCRETGSALHKAALPAVDDVWVTPRGTRFRMRSVVYGEMELETPLVGRHQADNAVLAVEAASLLPPPLLPSRARVVEGVGAVRWPGRFQVGEFGGVTMVLDVAHNPAGAAVLVRTLREAGLPRPAHVVLGVLADKDGVGILRELLQVAGEVVLTFPGATPPRRDWDPTLLAAMFSAPVIPLVGDALEHACAAARRDGGCVVVTGSTFTVAGVLRWMNLTEDAVRTAR